MFSFIGAGEDVVKVATTISITNTMVWENTSEGTKKMFDIENDARAEYCCCLEEPSYRTMSSAEKIVAKKNLSKKYYEKK